MSMPTSMISSRRQQQGVVLFVALILLLVLTSLGVLVARNQMTEERMAGNEDNHQLAFQAAEAAVRAAEDDLGNGVYSPWPPSGTVAGLYTMVDELNVAPNDSVVNNPAFNWTNPANTLPYRGPPLLGIPVNAQQPTVVIEKLPATIIRGCQSSSSAAVFRITAHAVGGDNNAQAIVQTIFYNC